ncbi:hypothetical protein M9H77_07140 [Catharanthus roseus]|uniref:Uncharacterized protein n=1 Tax=Catharanthus roseus TaxID=4058 RepID=A0ACC0BU31_CATRO|nr:hypothetical protein M9H77_07140 [Catharanthus roseus]
MAKDGSNRKTRDGFFEACKQGLIATRMETMMGMLIEEATIEMDIPPIEVKWVLVSSLLELKLLIISFIKIVLISFLMLPASYSYLKERIRGPRISMWTWRTSKNRLRVSEDCYKVEGKEDRRGNAKKEAWKS